MISPTHLDSMPDPQEREPIELHDPSFEMHDLAVPTHPVKIKRRKKKFGRETEEDNGRVGKKQG